MTLARPGLLALASVLLVASDRPEGADGYSFVRSEFVRDAVLVRVVFYPNWAALREAASGQPNSGPYGTRTVPGAFTEISLTRPACTIHTLAPEVGYRPEVLGHETMHCLRGRWHD